jgi:hypothetical protein
MARIVVRCQYTGHYMLTGFDTRTSGPIAGGRIHCPYCDTDHVWSVAPSHRDDAEHDRLWVQQAG